MNKERWVDIGIFATTFVVSFYIFNLLPLPFFHAVGSPLSVSDAPRMCSLNYLYCYSDFGDPNLPKLLMSEIVYLFILPLLIPLLSCFLVFKLMKRRGFVNIVTIILAIVIVGVAGYLALAKFQQATHQQTDKPATLRPIKNNAVSQNPSTTLPATCIDEQEGTPVITYLSGYSGPVGTKLEIKGCNFSGFEGDKNALIENSQGVKGILYGEAGSTGKLLKVTLKSPLCQKDNSYSGLPCDAWLTLAPGTYKIYTIPWSKKSNKASFTIR